MSTAVFWVARSLRVPGLGLLVLPAPPAPAWLAAPPLHAALRLLLRRPGYPPLALPATIEEVAPEGQPPTRALLLDADPAGELGQGAQLALVEVVPDDLL
ncbi:hypothetical protein HHL22_16530 [Hymenobacter sp. RP-2-7]|uniref:Uncharacterized protein n=1 Tax=Hymenobacter polaris TaxID=2682546 RepID=A0A7Y0AG96_9BACT|nr:hypothetical protein [Hymenobacter polaris]NML66813.1 hypothetical protein [Hymenobacter polaris]